MDIDNKEDEYNNNNNNEMNTSISSNSNISSNTNNSPSFTAASPSYVKFRPNNERPIHKLSIQLISTYRSINKRYFEKKNQVEKKKKIKKKDEDKGKKEYDDDQDNYIIRENEMINGRYRVIERVGKGSFGQVVRVFDTVSNTELALKIIKNKKPFFLQSMVEIDILSHIKKCDQDDNYGVVRLLDHFVYRNHQCLLFELLSYNLYDLLKCTHFKGVSLNLIGKFARQLLRSLAFLARPDVSIIHCDLKPENILLCHSRKSAIKIIDFGSSCFKDKRMYTYIQSRFYRSIEVLLRLKYDTQIDMWSLGCVLIELHVGDAVFPGLNQQDQVFRIAKYLGLPPDHLIESAPPRIQQRFFVKESDNDNNDDEMDTSTSKWKLKSFYRNNKRYSHSMVSSATLEEFVAPAKRRRRNDEGHTDHDYELFLDLIRKMLEYDPAVRIKPIDALHHPFLNPV